MLDALALFAAEGSMAMRVTVCMVGILVGILLVMAGRHNIRTQAAEETGNRRTVNRLMGKSNTYEGRKAGTLERVRRACGIAIILFGIIFIFAGPFLAPK